jgi:hypothetical protein
MVCLRAKVRNKDELFAFSLNLISDYSYYLSPCPSTRLIQTTKTPGDRLDGPRGLVWL